VLSSAAVTVSSSLPANSSYPDNETLADASKNCFQNWRGQVSFGGRVSAWLEKPDLGRLPHGARVLAILLDERQDTRRDYAMGLAKVVVDLCGVSVSQANGHK
jgi:hypothetical protein